MEKHKLRAVWRCSQAVLVSVKRLSGAGCTGASGSTQHVIITAPERLIPINISVECLQESVEIECCSPWPARRLALQVVRCPTKGGLWGFLTKTVQGQGFPLKHAAIECQGSPLKHAAIEWLEFWPLVVYMSGTHGAQPQHPTNTSAWLEWQLGNNLIIIMIVCLIILAPATVLDEACDAKLLRLAAGCKP